MGATVSLNTKIDLSEKQDFIANTAALGLSPSAAIKVFVSMFNRCKGFPFDVRLAPRINPDNTDIPHATLVDGHLMVPASGEMMTMNEHRPDLYDVWKLPFEFEDQPGIVKERPVVVGAIGDDGIAILAVKVTGHGPRPEYLGEIWIEDWRKAGLEKRSVARCSKTIIVPVEAFANAMFYGKLSTRDANAIGSALRSLGITV